MFRQFGSYWTIDEQKWREAVCVARHGENIYKHKDGHYEWQYEIEKKLRREGVLRIRLWTAVYRYKKDTSAEESGMGAEVSYGQWKLSGHARKKGFPTGWEMASSYQTYINIVKSIFFQRWEKWTSLRPRPALSTTLWLHWRIPDWRTIRYCQTLCINRQHHIWSWLGKGRTGLRHVRLGCRSAAR